MAGVVEFALIGTPDHIVAPKKGIKVNNKLQRDACCGPSTLNFAPMYHVKNVPTAKAVAMVFDGRPLRWRSTSLSGAWQTASVTYRGNDLTKPGEAHVSLKSFWLTSQAWRNVGRGHMIVCLSTIEMTVLFDSLTIESIS